MPTPLYFACLSKAIAAEISFLRTSFATVAFPFPRWTLRICELFQKFPNLAVLLLYQLYIYAYALVEHQNLLSLVHDMKLYNATSLIFLISQRLIFS